MPANRLIATDDKTPAEVASEVATTLGWRPTTTP